MTQFNEESYETLLSELTHTIKEKNEVITHLTTRLKNQEKQIEILIQDAESKHHHEISKHYSKSYEKYLKYGKYLLLRVDEIEGNGIYLPNNLKIVHFGELEVSNWGGIVSFESANKKEKGLNDFGTAKTEKTIEKSEKNDDLKEIDLNKKDSSSLEKTCKGLSKQIETLKENLKNYTTLVKTNKETSTQKLDILHEEKEINPYIVESVIRYQNTPEKDNMQNSNKSFSSKEKKESVKEFPSISPIKKKNKTKTIFIRKQ